jgi:hypothetical protein
LRGFVGSVEFEGAAISAWTLLAFNILGSRFMEASNLGSQVTDKAVFDPVAGSPPECIAACHAANQNDPGVWTLVPEPSAGLLVRTGMLVLARPNDAMTSFYVRSPSGFEIVYGFGGKLVDDASRVVEDYDVPSSWGHQPPPTPLAPGILRPFARVQRA